MIDVDNAGGLSRLVVYNSQARKRQEMVTVRVSSHNIKVGVPFQRRSSQCRYVGEGVGATC